jgi:hypothetical protein
MAIEPVGRDRFISLVEICSTAHAFRLRLDSRRYRLRRCPTSVDKANDPGRLRLVVAAAHDAKTSER